jgi:hypothetical protein
MQETALSSSIQLTGLDRLNALPVSKLREGRALLMERFEEEVQAWAESVENHDGEETLNHWRAALDLTEQLKTVTWLISLKTVTGDL